MCGISSTKGIRRINKYLLNLIWLIEIDLSETISVFEIFDIMHCQLSNLMIVLLIEYKICITFPFANDIFMELSIIPPYFFSSTLSSEVC